MPDLQRETLLEELEIRLPNPPPSPLVLLSTDPTSSLEKCISAGEDLKRLGCYKVPLQHTNHCVCVRVMGTETQLCVYVFRLLQEREYKDDGNCETDLCSLIESLTCYSSSRLQRLKQKLQVLTGINSLQTESCARPMPPANQTLKKGISF